MPFAAQTPPEGALLLRNVYRLAIRDYVAALLLQRAKRRLSRRLQQCVTIGQLAIVLIAAWAIYFSMRGPGRPRSSAEVVALAAWFDANAPGAEVLAIAPWTMSSNDKNAARAEQTLRVRYRHVTAAGRGVEVERMFFLARGEVVGVEDDW